MNWNKEKSLVLSKLLVGFFALLLAALDLGCYDVVVYLLKVSNVLGGWGDGLALMAVIYICSVPGWITLWSLWRILSRLGRGEMFVEETVRDMRQTSWCCLIVAAVCGIGCCVYLPLLVIAAAAGLMGLIVRIVKNCFQQAVCMKDELDFTI